MHTKKVIIVDDEKAARDNIRSVINTFPELSIAAEATNGAEAIERINDLQPDIVFLDIEMPGMSGFDVVQATSLVSYQLVFVTAFQQYALDAFETRAIDYLLKPVRPDLIKKCITKIVQQEQFAREALDVNTGENDMVVLSDGKSRRVVRHNQICLIEGIGRYRQIHLTRHGEMTHSMPSIISDTTLEEFAEKLPEQQFIRVHRGYIVNVEQISRLFIQSRRYVIALREHEDPVPISRSKVESVKKLMDG